MKIDDDVIINKQRAIIVGLPGDLYFNPKINKEMKVPPNMVCVNTKTALLVLDRKSVV